MIFKAKLFEEFGRIALAWKNGKVWDNPPVPCMHSDPHFKDAPPGKTVRDRGRIFFRKTTRT